MTKTQNKLKIILTAFFAFAFFFFSISLANAATYYASPSGGGSGNSQSSPFQISNFWSIAKPGDTLLLLDGKYTGSNSMIDPPDNLSGSAGNPITVKALNDGKVEIDGQDARQPVKLFRNDYFVIEGFNAHDSNAEVVAVSRSDNNIIRRIIAWDALSDGNRQVFASNYGSDNLFEDVAGWGSGRKIFGLYSDTRTTFRRCFFRWSYHTDTISFWKVGITAGYYSTTSIIENCIGTWDQLSGTYNPQRYAIFGTDNYGIGPQKVYGNIGYHLNAQNGSPNNVFGTINFIPSINYKDLVAYTDPQVSSKNFVLGSTSSGSNITDAKGSNINADGSSQTLSALDGDLLQYNKTSRPSSGAWIRNRYINGVLTNQPLWPWPMNERIKEAMVTSGYNQKGGLDGNGGTDLQKTVFELGGGTCPSEVCGGTQQPPQTCASFTYSDWQPQACQSNQTQLRTVQTSSPSGCTGGTPITEQSCTYTPPPSSTNTLTSLKTLSLITTDGQLTESVWNQTNSVTFSNTAKSDNTVKVSTLYDDNNLYFAYQVTDSNREALNQGLWNDDGAEIYIDTQNNKSTSMDANDYHFMTNINDLTSGGTITSRTTTNATGYIQEIKIPFTTLNITLSNQTLGLLLANNDRDNNSSKQFDWLDLIETGSYSRPNLWGDLILSSQTIGTPPIPGDLDGNGAVNTLDWSLMNSAWGTADATADINNDGIVNTIDFSILNGNWGQ